MRNKIFLFLLAGLVFGAALGFAILHRMGQEASTIGQKTMTSRGLPITDFALNDLEDNPVSLSQYRGRVVILNFWATWCEPCKEEMALLEAVFQEYPQELIVLAVNEGESIELVRPFVEQYSLTFPVLLDPEGKVKTQYIVRGFPTTFFIDGEGVLQAQHIGQLNQDMISGYLKEIGVNID